MVESSKALVPVKKGGRPSAWTPEVEEEILSRHADGEYMIRICEEPHLPALRTVRGWDIEDRGGLAEGKPYEGFSTRYARAHELHTEYQMERVAIVAQEAQLGVTFTVKQVIDKHGNVVTLRERKMSDAVDRSRLDVDTQKWIASKTLPRRYGAIETAPLDGAGDESNTIKVIHAFDYDAPDEPEPGQEPEA